MLLIRSWRDYYKILSLLVLIATTGGGAIMLHGADGINDALPIASLQHDRELSALLQDIHELNYALHIYAFDRTNDHRQRLIDALDATTARLRDSASTLEGLTPQAEERLNARLAALSVALSSDDVDWVPHLAAIDEARLWARGAGDQVFQHLLDQAAEQRQRLLTHRSWMLALILLFGLFGLGLVLLMRRHHLVIGALQTSEAASRELRERLAWILYGAHVGAWEWEAQTGRVNIDERWATILGYGLDEVAPLSHESWTAFIHPDDRALAERKLAQHLRGETPYYECECRMRRKDGGWAWVMDRAKVISWTADGAPLRMAGARLDVTERKLAEERLRCSETNIRAILENIPQGMVVLDPAGRVVEFNQSAATLFGLPPQIYQQGRDFREVLAVWAERCGQSSDTLERVVAALNTPDAFTREFQLQVQSERRWCAFTHTPLPDGGCVRTFADVTQTKKIEETLRRSNADLEQFAYGVSHDLRQPLRMIRSYAQLLAQRLAARLEAEEGAFLSYVVDGAARMDQMLVSLLEYSRVGRTGEPMALAASRELVDEALLFLGPAIEEAGAEIHLHGVWPALIVSRDEMVRLFQNLIGNAVKYRAPNRPPVIDVTAERRGDEWLFTVRDNGVGVAPGQFDRLFKVFQRLHARDKYDGAGVGLALCRKIVERHGGRIWGESPGLDLGCVFCVLLPAPPGEPEATP